LIYKKGVILLSNRGICKKWKVPTYKPQILETFQQVRNFSFEEKRESVIDEIKMNKFLDRIIDFKQSLKIKTDKMEEIIENTEKITWFSNLDDDSLLIVNDLVSLFCLDEFKN
jgi:hypothetical protein